MSAIPPSRSVQTVFPLRRSAADMADPEREAHLNVGLPMDEDEQIPVGVRAMMTATNQLHGSF